MEQAAQRQAAALAAEQMEQARHTLSQWPDEPLAAGQLQHQPSGGGYSTPQQSASAHHSSDYSGHNTDYEGGEYEEDEDDDGTHEQDFTLRHDLNRDGVGSEVPFLRSAIGEGYHLNSMSNLLHTVVPTNITLSLPLNCQGLHSMNLEKCSMSDLMDLHEPLVLTTGSNVSVSCAGPYCGKPQNDHGHSLEASLPTVMTALGGDSELSDQCNVSMNSYKADLSQVHRELEQITTINAVDMDSLRQPSNSSGGNIVDEFLTPPPPPARQNTSGSCVDTLSLVMEQSLSSILNTATDTGSQLSEQEMTPLNCSEVGNQLRNVSSMLNTGRQDTDAQGNNLLEASLRTIDVSVCQMTAPLPLNNRNLLQPSINLNQNNSGRNSNGINSNTSNDKNRHTQLVGSVFVLRNNVNNAAEVPVISHHQQVCQNNSLNSHTSDIVHCQLPTTFGTSCPAANNFTVVQKESSNGSARLELNSRQRVQGLPVLQSTVSTAGTIPQFVSIGFIVYGKKIGLISQHMKYMDGLG